MKILSTVLLLLCTQASAKTADVIWQNGNIITINKKQPTVQALAVENGRILIVGSNAEVLRSKGPKTRIIDLTGKTLIPGFVDAHSHISAVGLQAMSANLLPPPDGPNSSIADLQKTFRDFLKNSKTPQEWGVLAGFGYDDAQLKEQRHPTRQELDQISTTVPIIAIHQSGHLGVLNSKALEKAGINKDSKNPPGGVIQREKNSSVPNGVLEENAFFVTLEKVLPDFTEKQNIALLEAGQKMYLRYGYTTIQDGRSAPGQIKHAIRAAELKKFVADVVSYPDILMPGTQEVMKAPYYHNVDTEPTYNKRFRIGGVKLTLDGSPQGKTAWLTKPYYVPPPGKDKDYAGFSVVPDEKVIEVYELALKNHWQILTHVNGDRAIDQMLSSFKRASLKYPGVDVRPVLIHGQTLRKDQVAEAKSLKILLSLFPMHTFYWGDWHRQSVLGPERAENISPTGWVLKAGMNFTLHHDAPVVNPDSMRVLSSAVTRKTRSGYVLGPTHKISPLTALTAMTLWSAYQHWEEKTKGSLEVGKLADMVILSENPLSIPEDKLIDIQVLETIKEGKTIYKASAAKLAKE